MAISPAPMGRPTFTTGGSVLNHDVHEVSLAVSPTDQRPGALPMEDCRPASVERIAGTFSARPHSGIRGGLPPRTAAYRLGGARDPAVSGRSRVANVVRMERFGRHGSCGGSRESQRRFFGVVRTRWHPSRSRPASSPACWYSAAVSTLGCAALTTSEFEQRDITRGLSPRARTGATAEPRRCVVHRTRPASPVVRGAA